MIEDIHGEIGERLAILNRIATRSQNYFFDIKDGTSIDLMEHFKNELECLSLCLKDYDIIYRKPLMHTPPIDQSYTAYIWVNWLYMNHKQWGIQTAHCISEMSRQEYGKDIYGEWADNHKTIIMYDGFNSGRIRRTYEIIQHSVRHLEKAGFEIPHVMFREDEESLDGAATACGFIIPNKIRQFDWESSAEFFRDNSEQWSNNFLPVLQAEEELDTPVDCDTESYYKIIQSRLIMSQRATEEYGRPEYAYDKFKLTEFSEWMRRQKLAM